MGILQQQSEQSAMEVRPFLWENKVKELPLRISKTNKTNKTKVPEDVYWEKYYELSDIHYEWNDGFLEEKPVSDYKAIAMFLWFIELLRHFMKVYPIGKIITAEQARQRAEQADQRAEQARQRAEYLSAKLKEFENKQ